MNHKTAMDRQSKGFDYHANLRKANNLRMDAEQADPSFQARYWSVDDRLTPTGANTHEEMLAFYKQVKVGS